MLADAPTIVLVVSRFVIEPGAILEVTFWVAAMMGAEAAMDRQGPAETESVASLEAPQRIVVRRVAAPSKSGRLVNPRLVWSTGLFR